MRRYLSVAALAGVTIAVTLIATLALSTADRAGGSVATDGTGVIAPGAVPADDAALDWIPGDPPPGVIYREPPAPPQVMREQAVAAAGAAPISMGGAAKASRVSARYVLMSHANPAEWASILPEKGLGHHSSYTNIPVWIVSYEGMNMPSSSGATHGGAAAIQPIINHELNVVVSAENGEVLGTFTYR